MKDFKRGGGFGGRKGGSSFGGHRDSGSRGGFGGRRDEGGRPEMHRATCADCGNSCEVPFRPSGDRPVYCSDCFKGKEGQDEDRGGRDRGGRDRERSFDRSSSFGEKRMFEVVCDNCGETCEVPFQPTAGKPVYCRECFGKNDKVKSNDTGASSNKQIEALNVKLDKILNILNKIAPAEKVAKEEIVKEVKKVEAKIEAEVIDKKASKKADKKVKTPKEVKPKKAKKK